MRRFVVHLCLVLFLFSVLLPVSTNVLAKGTLSPNWRIDSKTLGYALQYRVYLPETASEETQWPTIYVTDGQWYLNQGRMIEILDREIAEGNMEPVLAVFVDSRNPDDLTENRRNEQFICNPEYARFFIKELIPTISANFTVSNNRQDRVIAGVSFGGLNAACFGLLASNMFAGIGMQSPANAEHLKVLRRHYKDNQIEPLSFFFSVGTRNDNEAAARKFHRTLEQEGYDVNYIEVPYGHDWLNWQPLIDDMLLTFFAKKSDS